MKEEGRAASIKAAMEPRKMKQKKMSMSNSMAIKRSYCGVFMILGLVTVTLYMAFAFPYSLFHLKQTETTEIKSVIIVARNGERSPSPDSYFIGEEQPDDLVNFGYEQLTNTGKERMYLLGKYLRLRYYQLLLNGNPRKIYVRSADSDRCLESAQALLAGLNPPKDRWVWSSQGELNHNWQPKAVHSAQASEDDLLSAESECLKLEDKEAWKNSTRYQQLLSEFRHDLQTLRANTGLEFEDDLEMLSNIEDALRTRKAFDPSAGVPSWYTNTLANRLVHISDVTAESRFSSPAVQRLYVGRLLYEIARNVNSKIRLLSLTADAGASGSSSSSSNNNNNGGGQTSNNDRLHKDSGGGGQQLQSSAADEDPPLNVYQMQQKNKVRANPHTGPNMFIYLTGKNRLTALLNSLQIYSSQLHFGSLLLIELHHDPINQVHFLRLFTVSSQNPSTFPEPLRVNPNACLDSAECYPQQFEQNIRHLLLDKNGWQEACSLLQESNYQPAGSFDPHTFKPQPLWPTAIDELKPSQAFASTLAPPTSTPSPASSTIDGSGAAADEDRRTTDSSSSKELEDSLIVGPLSDKKDNPSSSSPSSIVVVNPQQQQQQPASTNQTKDGTLPPSGASPNSTSTAATQTDRAANASQPKRGEPEETPPSHRHQHQHRHHTDSIETVNNQGERMQTD